MITGAPSASAWAVTPVSSVTTVSASLKTSLRAAHVSSMSAALTCTPSLHVTPLLIVYETDSGSSDSTVHVPN